jgi:membrane protein required for colicin V production
MLTAFDVGVGILVLISAILATARGLTREVLSLATWAGSAAIAVYMWQYQPQIAEGFIDDPNVAAVATILVSFIVALIVLHLITMRIADFVGDSRIGPLDRTLGFVFGILRGVLIAIVVVIFGTWLLGANASNNYEDLPPWARESKSLPVLDNWGRSLIGVLPDDLEAQVTQILEGRGGETQGAQEPATEGTDEGEDSSVPGEAPPVEEEGGAAEEPAAPPPA